MRKPDDCRMEYCGFRSPRDFDEIQFELLGLENLIKKAEERVSMLNQSSYLAKLAVKREHEDLETLFSEGTREDEQ